MDENNHTGEELLLLLGVIPEIIRQLLLQQDLDDLIEIVMDLGRLPEARFPERFCYLGDALVSRDDLDFVVGRVGSFSDDNRAGIERTLHRISAIRNRQGMIVGLTLRVGRAMYGTINSIHDVVALGKSILLLGRPGVGKTTMLRETARVLADEMEKRVVVVDTSNEIAGDGDIPHPGIGHARRMQVPQVSRQHAVMIEAVENHMPEVVVIDEISTEQEAAAARTIAERGVQLLATAHGITLQNLVQNPTLSDLIGGIQTVTLSDEEARRRGTQKSVLERKEAPTFELLIELQSRDRLLIHFDVAATVDLLLRGHEPTPEIRVRQGDGQWQTEQLSDVKEKKEDMDVLDHGSNLEKVARFVSVISIYPYAVNRNLVEKAIRNYRLPIQINRGLEGSDVFLTLKSQLRRLPEKLLEAHQNGIPVITVRANTTAQIEIALRELVRSKPQPEELPRAEGWLDPLEEAELAIEKVMENQKSVELQPQDAYYRRLQHELAEQSRLRSRSVGEEPARRVLIYI